MAENGRADEGTPAVRAFTAALRHHRAGRPREAKREYRRALALAPDYAAAHNNLGVLLRNEGRYDEAVASYRRAVIADPDYVIGRNNFGVALQEQGRLDEALAAFRETLERKPKSVQAHSNLINCMIHRPGTTAAEILAEARSWDRLHAAPRARRQHPHTHRSDAGRKLRIGYVSPDFRRHSVSYFLEAVLAAHDRQRVAIFCYGEIADEDETTARYRRLADGWYSTLRQGDDDVAARIRADGIDILVDLAGHTAGNRLLVFAGRPAPVQVSWLGFGASTGLAAMDYRLTDDVLDPPGESEDAYAETLVRLPGGFVCYAAPTDAPDVVAPPANKLGRVTFGSFNNVAKVTPEVVLAWAEILMRVPDARLVLKGRALGDEGTRGRYLDMFARHGIAAERLDILGRIPSPAGHLGAYGRVDIALDPFPYGGGTTSCEALWMGVPVVALRGERFVGRMGASLLTRLGLEALIGETTTDYIDKAVALAGDRERLTALRAGLRERLAGSPLADASGFARDLEAAYRDMWRRWCAEGG